MRIARNFHGGGWSNELGGSLALARLHNRETDDDGTFWAAGYTACCITGRGSSPRS